MPNVDDEQTALMGWVGQIEQATVEVGLPKKDLSAFWSWLGKVKFVEDEGSMTSGRAAEIYRDAAELVAEFSAQN